MEQNDTSASFYKAGAGIMLDACKTYFTCMERIREVQRRTDAEFADATTRHAGKLENVENMAQCSVWQQQAYAEQIGRWNQYVLELIQAVLEGQTVTQTATRNGLDHMQKAYMTLATHLPAMPYNPLAGVDLATPANRKHNSQRASAH
ncbi:hypothetical protein [Castellaniella denitrificans]|jgi:hypothetical protein|uniref:Phasin domain-containing protein n=1 Tax=Castellaniella denitrificans TaxID=56119 RepID=A0ABT4M4N0_9BURK|nr:hypothetical protein [Castellaniella denitrificans]MCZ4330276.1 hypothetical protein [Castellaniella denitrificans]